MTVTVMLVIGEMTDREGGGKGMGMLERLIASECHVRIH